MAGVSPDNMIRSNCSEAISFIGYAIVTQDMVFKKVTTIYNAKLSRKKDNRNLIIHSFIITTIEVS